jgi:hypothetical protein
MAMPQADLQPNKRSRLQGLLAAEGGADLHIRGHMKRSRTLRTIDIA